MNGWEIWAVNTDWWHIAQYCYFLLLDTIELLNMPFETAVQYQDSVQGFIDNLKNDAEAIWKASFLQAVKSKCNTNVIR